MSLTAAVAGDPRTPPATLTALARAAAATHRTGSTAEATRVAIATALVLNPTTPDDALDALPSDSLRGGVTVSDIHHALRTSPAPGVVRRHLLNYPTTATEVLRATAHLTTDDIATLYPATRLLGPEEARAALTNPHTPRHVARRAAPITLSVWPVELICALIISHDLHPTDVTGAPDKLHTLWDTYTTARHDHPALSFAEHLHHQCGDDAWPHLTDLATHGFNPTDATYVLTQTTNPAAHPLARRQLSARLATNMRIPTPTRDTARRTWNYELVSSRERTTDRRSRVTATLTDTEARDAITSGQLDTETLALLTTNHHLTARTLDDLHHAATPHHDTTITTGLLEHPHTSTHTLRQLLNHPDATTAETHTLAHATLRGPTAILDDLGPTTTRDGNYRYRTLNAHLHQAITTHTPLITHPNQATALATLEPTFTGTYRDLLTSAHVIGATT